MNPEIQSKQKEKKKADGNNKPKCKDTQKATTGTERTCENTANDNQKQLTEKELRKLEWEKKLSQQQNEQGKDKVKNKENLSKAELKAKRREQQEAQRLAKAVPSAKVEQKLKTNQVVPEVSKETDKKPVLKSSSYVKQSSTKTEIKKKSVNKVQLVQHLYNNAHSIHTTLVNYKDVHPVFVRLGVQYSQKTILGANARTLALLSALKYLVQDLLTPPKQEFCRYLESTLQACTNHLQSCRPFAVSMTNALRHFKMKLTQITNDSTSDNLKKSQLIEIIDDYVTDEINKAGDAISLRVNEKISNGDVLLIYGCSSLIRKILLDAHKDGKQFEVIIVDSRPLLEGREMLRRLVVAGIKCTYILLNAISYIMSGVTKVLLGAHALLTNGYVMSRIGTAQVALMAQEYNKPVLVCCETYKFSERVQTDSFVHNEIGDSEKLLSIDTLEEVSPLNALKDNQKVNLLSLLYDVTPPDLVTAVVTELAILPCTSVPVVLRINAN